MDKTEFETMFGEDTIIKINYIELVNEIKNFLKDLSTFQIMQIIFVDNLNELNEEEGIETIKELLKHQFELLHNLSNNIGANILKKHWQYANNADLSINDFFNEDQQPNIKEMITNFIAKYTNNNETFNEMQRILNNEDEEK